MNASLRIPYFVAIWRMVDKPIQTNYWC